MKWNRCVANSILPATVPDRLSPLHRVKSSIIMHNGAMPFHSNNHTMLSKLHSNTLYYINISCFSEKQVLCTRKRCFSLCHNSHEEYMWHQGCQIHLPTLCLHIHILTFSGEWSHYKCFKRERLIPDKVIRQDYVANSWGNWKCRSTVCNVLQEVAAGEHTAVTFTSMVADLYIEEP